MPIYEVSFTIRRRIPGAEVREVTITDDSGASDGPGVLEGLAERVVNLALASSGVQLSSLTPEGRQKVERQLADRAAREREETECNGAEDEARRPGSLRERVRGADNG